MAVAYGRAATNSFRVVSALLRFYSPNISRYPGLLVLVIVPLLIALLDQTGALSFTDHLMRDQIVKWMPPDRSVVRHVLVVETAPQAQRMSSDQALSAIAKLRELNTRRIVLTRLPEKPSVELLAAVSTNDVVVGRYAFFSQDRSSAAIVEPLPSVDANGSGAGITSGLVTPPRTQAGSSHYFDRQTHGRRADEAMLAEKVASTLGVSLVHVPAEIALDFRGLPEQLPRATLDRLLNDGFVSELVAGKVVVLGDGVRDAELGIQIPTQRGVMPVSVAMWQALAIDALLDQRWIKPLSAMSNLILTVLIAGLALFVLPQRRSSLAIGAMFSTMVVLIVVTVCAWWAVSMWLPLSALLSTVFGTRWLSSLAYIQRIEFRLRNLLKVLGGRGSRQPLPTQLLEDDNLWPSFTHLARQIFPIKRMICLEQARDAERLHIAYTVDCSEGDIVERRRDTTRTPWLEVDQENWPAAIAEISPTRPILLERVNEDQYVVPLRYAGVSLGVWILCVESNAANAISRFREITHSLALDISEQLYRHREHQAQKAVSFAPVRAWLRLDRPLSVSANVVSGVQRIGQRVRYLEDLFDQIDDATVCFDLFGRVVFVNRALSDLLAKAKAMVFESTALQFLRELTGVSDERAKEILRQVVLEKQAIMLPVVHRWGGLKGIYVVRLRTFEQLGDATSGEIAGLMFQIVETDEISEPYRLQTQLARHLDYGLRNQLTSMLFATEMLQDANTSAEDARLFAQQIQAGVHDAQKTLERVRAYLHEDSDATRAGRMPMDPADSVLDLAEDMQAVASKRNVSIKIDCPKLRFLTVGDVQIFRHGLRGIFDLMVDEAYEGSTIAVTLSQDQERLALQIENDGSGFPVERLQDFIFGADDVDSHHLRLIRKMASSIMKWGGDFKVNSQVGAGISFQLSLLRIL